MTTTKRHHRHHNPTPGKLYRVLHEAGLTLFALGDGTPGSNGVSFLAAPGEIVLLVSIDSITPGYIGTSYQNYTVLYDQKTYNVELDIVSKYHFLNCFKEVVVPQEEEEEEKK